MSQKTKLFGFEIPIQPKFLLSGLFAAVVSLAIDNFVGGSDDAAANSARSAIARVASSSASNAGPSASRRLDQANRNKQGVLRLKPVDPSVVVDPTLKLALLDRVRAVKPFEGGRNLFETASEVASVKLPPIPVIDKMLPKPLPQGPTPPPGPPPPPQLNIPLRYYGFVRPSLRTDGNRGYFMDGDNILMATEGDVLESRFLVVALSPNNARVEDIQLKQGQDLQLIPEAVVTQ
jgi:hypothetical protein